MKLSSLAVHVLQHSVLQKAMCAGRSLVLLIIRLAFGFEAFQSGYAHLHNVPATKPAGSKG
jgi:uncharacterized membrane protein YphA (DoxX/SURF4 family)